MTEEINNKKIVIRFWTEYCEEKVQKLKERRAFVKKLIESNITQTYDICIFKSSHDFEIKGRRLRSYLN